MSRLRRLATRERVFFITCNLLLTRTRLTGADLNALADAIDVVRRRRGFLLAGYVLMPDHWHALVIPRDGDTLPKLMGSLKVASMRRINSGRRARGPVWQSRFYDHVIRNVKEYHDAIRYMHLNPVSKGLVARPEDWLWSSFHSFGGPGPIRLPVDRFDLPADEKTPL